MMVNLYDKHKFISKSTLARLAGVHRNIAIHSAATSRLVVISSKHWVLALMPVSFHLKQSGISVRIIVLICLLNSKTRSFSLVPNSIRSSSAICKMQSKLRLG